MIETSSRIVRFQNNLSLIVRKYEVKGHAIKPNQQMKLISVLEKMGIVAIKLNELNEDTKDKTFYILVESRDRILSKPLTVDGWNVSFHQVGNTFKIEIKNPQEKRWVEEFYLRNLQINIKEKTNLWVYKGNSKRQFYETHPFDSNEEINGFRRYDLSAKYIENVGLAINVEVKTAYFTKNSIEFYFSNGLEDKFAELSERYQDLEYIKYKGTLLYKGPNYFTKCYFNKFCKGMTLSTTPPLTIEGTEYNNVYDYYQHKYPEYEVSPDDSVALVTFAFGDNSNEGYVAAKNIRLRVMNSALDDELSQEDKIEPGERIRLIDEFWKKLGNKPFGENLAGLHEDFYKPDGGNSGTIQLPDLIFGNNFVKSSPNNKSPEDYRIHYRQVHDSLKNNGCYFVPKVIDRNLHFSFPSSMSDLIKNKFIEDLTSSISNYTKCQIEPISISYDNIDNAYQSLMNLGQKGIVTFVFENNDPATYYNISYELEGWKIKRVTTKELINKYNKLIRDLKNKPINDFKRTKGEKNWESFVNLIALGIIQKLGCIPYIFKNKTNYGMYIKIDVSEKFRFFGIGLMIYSDRMQYPIIDHVIKEKSKRNDIVETPRLEKWLKVILARNSSIIKEFEIKKALVLRDGQEFGSEYDAFCNVVAEMKGKKLPVDFGFDFIEYHKDTANEIRIWERISKDNALNVLEGTFIKLDSRTALLATTGSGTLNQGTARPIYLHSKYGEVDMDKVIHDVFLTSQLNYNSPSVAQRLTLLAKRVNDLLRDKKAQAVEQLN